MNYRIAFLSEGVVNWCPELGTVLANDEVKDGFSERGAHPVEQKKMVQWSLRISAYAERLLKGLEKVDFSNSDMSNNKMAHVDFEESDLSYTNLVNAE